jgi:hypothetical protein
MESAARVATRYRDDPTLRPLCATILPIAGLLAETGLTLREAEAAAIRTVASTSTRILQRMLLSADDFAAPDRSALTLAARRDLLARFGMFGLRLAIAEVRSGRAATATQLSSALVAASGLPALWQAIRTQLVPRAEVLKARTALLGLRALARSMTTTDPTWSAHVAREAERIEAAALEFAELRLQHLVMSETIRVTDDERREITRVTAGRDVSARHGLADDGPPAARRAAALAGIDRWRTRASDPLADSALIEASETMVRAYEAVYASTLAEGS